MTALRSLTTAAEQARAERYRFDADRQRHLAGRGLVRTVLAHRYDCSPTALSIEEGPHGKPQLNRPEDEGPPLAFNIAHSADVVVVAVSRTHPVGIDIESLDRDVDADALAERVFTATERERWRNLPPSRRARFFMRVWTCKEAFLKATGRGLQRAPRTVQCAFDGDTIVGVRNAEPSSETNLRASAENWALRTFSASSGIVGAVVRKEAVPSALSFVDASRLIHQFSRG